MPFDGYNDSRYSKPWGARITFEGGRAHYDFNAANYIGDAKDGGDVVIGDARPGDIVAFGQKDKRGGNSVNDWAVVENSGDMRKISKKDAFTLYNRIKKAEEETEGNLDNGKVIRQNGDNNNISNNENGIKEGEKKGDGNGGADTGGSTASVAVREPEIVQAAEEERPEVAGRGVEGARGDVDGGDKGGDVSGGKSGYDMVRPAAEAADEAAGNAGLAGAVRRTEAGGGSRPGSVGVRGGRNGDAEGDAGRLEESTESGLSIHDAEFASESVPSSAQSNTHPEKINEEPKLAGENPGNFIITDEVRLGQGTPVDKLKANVEALRILKRVLSEKRYATKEEQTALARYVGWGGLPNAFADKNANSSDAWGNAYRDLKSLLSQEEYNAAMMSTRNAHYTPEPIVRAMWRAAEWLGFTRGNVMEPTVGVGNFIGLQPEGMRLGTHWYAAELDMVSGRIASLLYPDADIRVGKGFEYIPFKRGAFDFAIGNPPFASDVTRDHRKLADKKDLVPPMNLHSFIMAKTGDHLRPGGIMEMVITHRFLDAMSNNGARDYLAHNFKLLGAVRLPNDAFKKNAGTDVVTDILFLQKLHVGEAADTKGAWLDADGSVTVDGVTMRVNRYFAEHPENILGRSAMDGKMYSRGRTDGEGEYTVHSDGRDLAAAIDEAVRRSLPQNAFEDKTPADVNLSAAESSASNLSIGGMRLGSDGKVYRRGVNSEDGVERIEEITPRTPWKDEAREYQTVIDDLRDMKKAYKEHDDKAYDESASMLVDEDTAFRRSAGGKMKEPKTNAEKALAAVVENISGGARKWVYDSALEEIEKSLERKVLGEGNYRRLQKLLELRNMSLHLMEAERADMKESHLDRLRAELNRAYDAFVKEYGYLGAPENQSVLLDDRGAEQGLEIGYSKGVSPATAKRYGEKPIAPSALKSGLLTHRVYYPSKEITHVNSVDEGFKVSLNQRGRFDVNYIAGLIGKSPESVIAELTEGEEPRIFFNGDKEAWEDADTYLSGNIRRKLNDAEARGDRKAVAALKKAMPAPKKKENITPSLRGTWVPAQVYADFLSLLGVREPNVVVNPRLGYAAADTASLVQDNELNAKYKNSADVSVTALFNYASSDRAARITMPGPVRGGKPTRVLDEAKTKEVNDLIGELKKDFSRWVYAEEARTKTVVDAYNEKMNIMVERKYDGVSHLGEVNGQNPDIRLRDTQKNAAWRMIQTDNVLLDHVVGAGKTFTAITGIMQRKQMGLSRKPLVAVPNHLVSQWASDFYKLYPGANILAIAPEEFSKKKRRAFIARMATGDYDAIIVGHSSLRFLENSAKDEQRVIQEQVTLLREAIGFADDDAGDWTVKSLANKTKKYEEKLSSLSENAAKNSDKLGFNFEDMGVDYLVVDEAHEFKNLEYATASDRIVGMNDPNGSMKAWDLYTKVRGIQERGGGVVFATGTPVSNSLVELYTIMKYLGHDEMKAQGKLMFDAWKNDYTETETRVEYTPTQEVKERRVLSKLINLNSMQKQYRAFADVISQQDRIVSYKEEMEALNAQDGGKRRTELPIPHVYGGGRQLNIAPKGEVMQQIMDWLVARMKTYEGASSKKAYSSVDNPLWIMTDARIASLDPRTIDPSLPREANGKVMRAAKSIKRLYDKWNAERGTQLVFCDGSVPSDAAKKKAKDKIKEAVEMLYPSNRMKREHEDFKYELDRRYNAFSDKWGYIKDVAQKAENEALNEWIEANDSEISAAMNVADSGFSVYNDLKEVLVGMGIPEKEVAFVHDFNGDKKKRELFDKVNRGAIRVLIGSSQKMGAGMNAQERLVGLHHLDAPWRPSDMEQREGRIIRQGNVLYDRDPDHFSVEITAYATEGTNDTVMWTILQRKQAAIDMVRQGREIDVVEEESDAADSYAQFMAQSTGDPVFMKKVEAERDMREKEAEISGIRLARESAKDFLGKYEQDKKLNEARVSELKKSPVESTGVFKEYAAALDAEEKRYQRALAEYEKGKKKYDDDYSRWKAADKDGRGRKPIEPVKPHAPNLFSEGIRNRSKWARDVVSMLTEMNETATRNRSAEDSVVTRSIDVGGSGSVVLTAKPYPVAEGVTAWRAYYALSDGGNFSLFDTVVDVKNPLNSGVLAQALSLTNIAYKQKHLLENFQKRGAELDHKKKSGEELLARKFDEKPVQEAVQRFKWYEAMTSIAEAKNSAARAERGANPLIENEKMGRLLNVSAMKQEEPRTVTIGNEKYETTGVYNKLPSGLLGYEAREAGGERRPVILQAGKSKDNEGHEWLGVIRQPDSVAAEEANEGEAYRLTPRPQSAQARLESDAAAFSKQVDDFIAGKMGRHELFDVMRTPLVLQISDERVKALPVVMTQSTLKKIFSKHNLSPALVKQIPRALADPIMVLDSEGKQGQIADGFVVMLEMKGSRGAAINVPIALNAVHKDTNGEQFICNDIASVYGRMSATTGKPYNEWFLKQAEKPGLLKYINIKKFSRWVDETGIVLPGRGYNSERLFDILSKIGTDVNAKKFSRGASQAGLDMPGGQLIGRLPTSIKTESDLVKAREADISAYALGGRPVRPMPPVTAEMIAPYVPKGLTVKKLPGGQVSIGGPSGFAIVLSNRDEPITPNAEVVKRDYGREPSSSDVVTGRTRIMGRRAFVDFVNGMSSADDFNHELYEIARNVFMSGAERKMMSVDFPNKEAEAEGYKDFMNGRIAGETTGRAARIFRRIRDFFARLRASLFGKRSKDIFRDIAEGRMWKREMRDDAGGTPSTAERYRRAYTALRDIVDGADEATIRDARHDISTYGGTNDVTLVWGDGKKGLAHIGGKRGADTAGNIVRTVLDGRILKYVEAKKTLHIGWNDYEAVLSLDENGKSKTWLLTGWAQNRPDAVGEVGTQSDATHNRPTFSRSDMGAGLKVIVEQYNRLVNEGGADGESYRLVRKGEPESPTDYAPPVTMKTAKASASGRTAKESTLWGRIAEESGLEPVVKRSEPKNTLKERIIRARDTLEYELFDDLKPLARMFGDDVYDVARYETDGIDAKATALIIDGEPDAGVKGIGRILDGMNPGEIDGFTHYLEWKNLQDVANMTEESTKSVAELEKMAAEEDAAIAVLKKDKDLSQDDGDRKMLDTAIKGREIYAAQLRRQANESRRYIRETRGNSERYAEAVRKLEEAYPDWIEKQKEVAKFNKFVLDEYRKAGVISGELYDFLSKTRPNYVPAHRDFSDVEPGFDGTEAFIRAKGMVNIGEPFRKMKGSKRDIVNPIEGIVKNAYRMTKMRAQQKMANAVLKKVSESGELEGVVKRTKKRDSSPGHHVFYVWELGKKAYYETPDISIYRILTMVDANAADTGIFFSMLANTAKLLRAGVSHSLRFSLWNPERDTMSASVYGTGFRPVIDSIIGMTHAAKKDDVFWDYMRAGGGPSRAFLSDKKLEGIIRELYGATTRNPVTALWNALGRLNEISEQGTRIGVYQRGIECGMTKEDADRLATEATINFNKGGRFSKKVSRYIPFFNSNMQDIYKLYNAHFGKKSKFNPGFKRMAGKGLLMLTLPSMLLWAYNNGSDERRKRYLRIPQWQKNNFWWVVSPDGKKAFPYPKPFALGILYGSMPERILDYMVYKDRRAVEQVMTSLFASLAPGYAPLLIQMMFEQFANKSLFYGREIVPRAEQEIDARLQYGPYTSEWAKYVGKYAGLSPRRVEYATFGILGNLGKEVSTVADDVMRSDVVTKLLDNGNTRAKKDWYEYIPVLNNVIMSTRHFKEPLNAWNGGSGYRRLEGAYKTAKIIYETEGPNALTDKQKLLLVNEQEVKNILRLNSGKDGIWALQRLERRIQMDKSLSSQQKRDEIDKIDEQILLLAEFGLAFISRFEESIKSIEDSMDARREEERSK